MEQFSVQRYVWDCGQIRLGPVLRAHATSHRSAAEQIVGRPMVDAGPVDLLAVKVWRYGKVKGEADVVRYWSPAGPG